MKTSRAFSPAVSDTLETRSVPSSMGFATAHAFAVPHTAASTVPVVVHPPGTFSNGTPGIRTATNGEFYTLNGLAPTSHNTVRAAAVVNPTHAVTPAATTPVVVHQTPGTFSNGAPGIHTATNGELYTLNSFRR